MKYLSGRPILPLLLVAALWSAPAAGSTEEAEATELVDKARIAVQRLARDPDVGPSLRHFLGQAKAVLIFPTLIKGAFLVGGEGGSGVLLTRNEKGSWSYPAFYTMASVSFGLQIGGQTAEAMLLIHTDGAVESVLEDQMKLGADASVAAGPIGAGIDGATTSNVGPDILTFSTSQGFFAGASLEGAVIARRQDWNRAFYKAGATPHAIVIERAHANPAADELREALSRF
ncbi:MAG: lipid-binding SYLF domain-containing protein [Alphaproteobacteria bacterium]|nr:lipid-binding SYLF domain-containing protein [Alphaproteobacteria bacterium]